MRFRIRCEFRVFFDNLIRPHAGSRAVAEERRYTEHVVGVESDAEFRASAGGLVCGPSFR